jgi:hypothetical protein
MTLDVVRVEEFIRVHYGYRGRPPKDRIAIAHAFIAKAVLNLATTPLSRTLAAETKVSSEIKKTFFPVSSSSARCLLMYCSRFTGIFVSSILW